MNTAVEGTPNIREVRVTRDEIIARLTDGRTISVPLAWSWRLSEATAAQRRDFRLIGQGQGIHWPQIDEDLSIEGMLRGAPARRPKAEILVRAQSKKTAGVRRLGVPLGRRQD